MSHTIEIQENQSSVSEKDRQSCNYSFIDLRQYISPPNPIAKKKEIHHKEQTDKTRYNIKPLRSIRKLLDEELTLFNFYDSSILVFQKYQNKHLNKRNETKYAASIFSPTGQEAQEKMKYIGMVKHDDLLHFNSEYESANLFRAYRTNELEYDLVLQNDTNTTGYAQWFNFRVMNKKKNIIIKFNIVNLYKSASLYQKGMKPLTISKINPAEKYHRLAFNVQYFQNQIPTERDRNQNYFTLTFAYEFKDQNDEVQFSHFYPYTTADCQNFLSQINGQKKVKLKTIGTSFLQKPIPIIQLSSTFFDKRKRAIVIIGRQHSGETQSSFLIEEIVNLLLGPSSECEFILEKFNIYICPMLNPDGVELGNYRTNFSGFDLNRSWLIENQLKIPEVYYIKRFISEIKKKQPISLVLDLHGHSKKFNSFFFSNPYGKNYMLLPYIASKMSDMIRLKSCTFTEEKTEKSHTARAVLGNMLKDSTYVYTFQVSFWGYKKNNRINLFTIQSLRDLSKTLVNSIYKVFLEQMKEEITLKESAYLREINRQLDQIKQKQSYFQKQSGSDSEAQKLTIKENQDKLKQQLSQDNRQKSLTKKESLPKTKDVGVQFTRSAVQRPNPRLIDFFQQKKQEQPKAQKIKTIKTIRFESLSEQKISPSKRESNTNKVQKARLSFINRQPKMKKQVELFDFENTNNYKTSYSFLPSNVKNKYARSLYRKEYLLQKLRIFGETFNQVDENRDRKLPTKITKVHVQVQVPQIEYYKSTIDSQFYELKTSRNDNSTDFYRHEQFQLSSFNKHIKQNKKQQQRTTQKSITKRKTRSLFFHKPAIEHIKIYNQKSLGKLSQATLNNTKKSLIKIQNTDRVARKTLKEFVKRQSTIDSNILLKGKGTSQKKQSQKKLPDIELTIRNSKI